MAGEIPLGIPEEVVTSVGYQTWKKEALDELEPPHPVDSRQRFAPQDTHYSNPDMDPGVVRFRKESEGLFEPDLVGEAETVQDSMGLLRLSGRIASLKAHSNTLRERLTAKAKAGWRGTEFDDLDGIGRALSAIPQRGAKVVDRDMLMMTTGENFPNVAESIIKLSVHVPEGHKVRGRVIRSEDLVAIIESVLAKARLSGEWTTETVIKDLDILRELIERDLVSPESVEIERDFTLRPDVLPRERTPKPKEAE